MGVINYIKSFFDRIKFGVARSSRWSSVRDEFIKKHPLCAVCGTKGSLLKPLNVHHLIPYSQDSSLELSMDNLITVCRDHHFFVCHLMSWKSWNKDVIVDCKIWNEKIKNRPQSSL